MYLFCVCVLVLYMWFKCKNKKIKIKICRWQGIGNKIDNLLCLACMSIGKASQ